MQATEGEELITYTEGIEPNEIILDNEDSGFKLSIPKSNSLIQKIFMPSANDSQSALVLRKNGKTKEFKYKGMVNWNFPVEWTLTTNEQFYGKQIR